MFPEYLKELVEALKRRLEEVGKREDLTRITETGYSFEGWLKWEAFCEWKRTYQSIAVEQRYPGSDPGYRPLCDIVLKPQSKADAGNFGWIELAVVHDWTSAEWVSKIAGDLKKIEDAQLNDGIVGGVVVVCATNPIHERLHPRIQWAKSWEEFFAELQRKSPDPEKRYPEGRFDQWSGPEGEMRFAVFTLVP